jgi:hypothetical protein
MVSDNISNNPIIQFIKKLYNTLQLSKIIEIILLAIWKVFFDSKPIFTM